MKKSLIWIRRNIRLDDNKVIEHALNNSDKVCFCFCFDSDILQYFPNKNDRRLSFITDSLFDISDYLKKYNSQIIVLYGKAHIEIPKICDFLKIDEIFADEDFEPHSKSRDANIKELLDQKVNFNLVLDHLLIHPSRIVKEDGSYKVFTPFMKNFRSVITNDDLKASYYNFNQKIYPLSEYNISELGFFDLTKETRYSLLSKIGYEYFDDPIWKGRYANQKLEKFIEEKILNYKIKRDFLDFDGTSSISPYLRFGQISIRKCFRKAFEFQMSDELGVNYFDKNISSSIAGAFTWINELIWREFYVNIMYNFPHSMKNEFQEKYIGKIPWNENEDDFRKFCDAKTGFPVIDASIIQLKTTGWMHNRARMIVANFLTKNLLIDWRKGEWFFSQYLMDYELSSNVGGWQWSSSTGTDAQPYFRIFNPITQSQKFDPEGRFIKKYLPLLEKVSNQDIHDPDLIQKKYFIKDYPVVMVDYKRSREKAIKIFENI